MKPFTFGVIVAAAAMAASVWWNWRPSPPARHPELSEWDKEVLLCDRAVDTFLHTKDALELTRAQMIIQIENCGIGKRL
jgi:hypothetical protein